MCFNEGESTIGVWLPLAMAETVAWLKVIVRMLGNDHTRRTVTIPATSEQLKNWCLPLMGAAVAADERRYEEANRKRKRETMFESLMELARRTGAKVTKNG